MSRLRAFVREPLVHFLLLGAGLFAAYGLVARSRGMEPRKIVVTQAQIESLATGFARTWQRPPTEDELEGLIGDYVREEVYSREAMTLGLASDDTIIRRRLRQKMEFLTEDIAAQTEPTDDELRAYLKQHPDSFGEGPRFSFSQVHLDPARRGDTLARDIDRLLASLNEAGAGADISALGDSQMLEQRFESIPGSEVEAQFGKRFADTLNELAPGRWQGPVESAYGVHLVFLRERTAGHLPAFEEIRNAVRREWTNVKRRELNEQFYHELLSHYSVSIERGDASEAPAKNPVTVGSK